MRTLEKAAHPYVCLCNLVIWALQVQAKGTSLMQPHVRAWEETLAFKALSAADAAPDTAYFHKFFEVKAAREAAGLRSTRKKKLRDEGEDGPLGDDKDSLADSEAASEEIGICPKSDRLFFEI